MPSFSLSFLSGHTALTPYYTPYGFMECTGINFFYNALADM